MRRLLPAVFSVLIAASAHAQPLFNAVANPVQPNQAIARVFGDPPTIRSRQVTLNAQYFAAQAASASGELVINLFPDFTVTALHDVVEQGSDATKWRGPLSGQSLWGRAILAVSGSHIAGLVQKDGRVFLIKPITEQVHLVSELRQHDFPIEAQPLASPAIDRTQSAADGDGHYTLRVMLVMDTSLSALCWFSWLQATFESVFEANLDDVWDTFTTSTIRADVTIFCSQHSATGGDLSADLTWVSSDVGVAAERNARAADIVSFIVPSSSSTICGLGRVNGPPVVAADESRAFSVVVAGCALGNYSLAHEIGHNMGMRHDRATEGGGDPAACNYGYWITWGGVPAARTVMAYDCPTGCTRLGVHSYPWSTYLPPFGDVVFGIACGSPTGANNIEQLEQAAPVMEAFR